MPSADPGPSTRQRSVSFFFLSVALSRLFFLGKQDNTSDSSGSPGHDVRGQSGAIGEREAINRQQVDAT